jgi:hypothetical protein
MHLRFVDAAGLLDVTAFFIDKKRELMAKKAKKQIRRSWTKDDLRELKALAKKKTPVAKIAKALKRTPGATTAKAFTIGLSLDSRG